MRVDETRKKEHFVLRNDTLRFENPEHYVLRIIHVIVIMPLSLTIIFIHAKTTWVIKNLEFH